MNEAKFSYHSRLFTLVVNTDGSTVVKHCEGRAYDCATDDRLWDEEMEIERQIAEHMKSFVYKAPIDTLESPTLLEVLSTAETNEMRFIKFLEFSGSSLEAWNESNYEDQMSMVSAYNHLAFD